MGTHGPLGAQVDYPEHYDPTVLHPIARSEGRQRLGIDGATHFYGVDVWNAFELSWLDHRGKPHVAVGEFHFPAASPFIVESKSFKLYLNSFNQTAFDSEQAVLSALTEDLSQACGAEVKVILHRPEHWDKTLCPESMEGQCLDSLDIDISDYQPSAQLLRCDEGEVVDQQYYSHLLRSRCPVTGQPDWASVSIRCRGPKIDEASLLRYLVSFRQQNDFHEQCVEQIFCDIQRACHTETLTVFARYLRRGGLDINPWRGSSEPAESLNPRAFRQ